MAGLVRRLFSALFGALVLGLFLCVLIDATGIAEPLLPELWFHILNTAAPSVADLPARVGWGFIAATGMVAALWIMRVSLAVPEGFTLLHSERDESILLWRNSGDAEVAVTLSRAGVGAVISKVALGIDGVRGCTARTIRMTRKGWAIDAQVWLSSDANVPQVSADLSDNIREGLERFSGRPVSQVHLHHSLQPLHTSPRGLN